MYINHPRDKIEIELEKRKSDTMSFDGIFTHYMIKELQEHIKGGRISKIYQLSNYELIFIVRANHKTQKVLFSIHPIYSRVQLTEEDYTYPQEPPMFCMLLRKHLEGGIIKDITQNGNDRIITFTIEAYNEIGDLVQKEIIIEVMGRHSNLILRDPETNKIIDCLKHIPPFQNQYRTLQPGAEYIFPPSQDKIPLLSATLDDFTKVEGREQLNKALVQTFEGVSPFLANEMLAWAKSYTAIGLYEATKQMIKTFDTELNPTIVETSNKDYYYLIPLKSVSGKEKYFKTLSSMLDRYYYRKDEQERIKQQTQDLEKFIRHELDKQKNKLANLLLDLNQAELADQYRMYGDLLMANSYHITKGRTSVEVENFYFNNEPIWIDLDPTLDAIQNAQKYYQRYQKAKKAIHHLERQIKLTKDEILYFETLHQQIESASLDDALEIRQELEQLGYIKKKKVSKQKRAKKLKYETYNIPGATIYVGKNNLQNDYLTFRLANRGDLWMHAKDMPGSHVIIRAEKLTEDILRTGAMLAAYYSKGKHSSSVPVDYTKVRYVKKIPGTKPGFVTYTNQKTIYIDPDEDFILNLSKN